MKLLGSTLVVMLLLTMAIHLGHTFNVSLTLKSRIFSLICLLVLFILVYVTMCITIGYDLTTLLESANI